MTLTDRTNALKARFKLLHSFEPTQILLGTNERFQALQEHKAASGGEIAQGPSDPGFTQTFCGLQQINIFQAHLLAVGTVITE